VVRHPRAATLLSAQPGLGVGAASGRLLALLPLLLFAVVPVRIFLLSPDARLGVKLAWLAALALGALRPRAGTLLLLGAPLLPIWVVHVDGVPQGIIHLLVLSQALPWLARVALGRDRASADPVALWLACFVTAAAVSVLVRIAALGQGFYSAGDILRAVQPLAAQYLFVSPGPGLVNMVLALSTIVDGMLVYLLIRRLPAEGVAKLTRGLAVVAAVVAVAGLVQARTRWGLQEFWLLVDPSIVRINATYTDPNALAAYFALMLPIVLALAAAAAAPRVRVFWIGAAGLCAVALLQTAGRMGYVGAFVGVLFLLGGAIRLGLDRLDPLPAVRRELRRVVVAGGLAAVVLVVSLTAIGTAWNVRHADQHSYVHTLLYSVNLRLPSDERLKGRLAIWRAVGMMIADRPVFGAGIGTIYAEFPPYGERAEAFDGTLRMSAHNTFLNVTAELGFLGLLIWIGVITAILSAAFRGFGTGERSHRWLRLGLAAGTLGYLVTMLTGDRIILREDVVVTMMVAALVVMAAPPAERRRRLPTGLAVAALVLIVASLPLRLQVERSRAPLDGPIWGFHTPETSHGMRFRWTTRQAVFHVPADRTTLRFSVRSLAPFPQTVDVIFDGRPADRLRLVDHNWQERQYVLPSGARGREFYRVELHVSPVWQPRHDDRELGVMVALPE
jgi:O-antigen ligase